MVKLSEVRLPTLLGLGVAFSGLIAGVWLVGGQVRGGARAAVEETPKEVRITNTNESSFTVGWVTGKAVSGFVQYGEEGEALDLVVSDERDQQRGEIGSYFTHFVTVKGLRPLARYQFKLGSGKGIYDQNGQAYGVTTGARLQNQPAADVAYGQIVTSAGEPAEGAIVYLRLPETIEQSALVKSTGSWVVPLSVARTSDLTRFATYDKEAEKIDILVEGGWLGRAKIATITANVSPLPQIALGTDYDFTKAASGEGQISADELSILSPRFEEKVNSGKPEIMGVGPANSEVKIEINSPTPIVGSAITDESGEFTFSVPTDLAPGEHTVTVSAVVDGVLKKVTRSFTVYAAGESSIPAFSATPSATVRPTARPSPTSTPKPSPTKTPAPTLLPTRVPTPRPTAVPSVSTPSALLEAGDGISTWWLITLGVGLIMAGGWWYKRAEDIG